MPRVQLRNGFGYDVAQQKAEPREDEDIDVKDLTEMLKGIKFNNNPGTPIESKRTVTNPRSLGDFARTPDCDGYWICVRYNADNIPVDSFQFLCVDLKVTWVSKDIPGSAVEKLFNYPGHIFVYLYGR